MNEEQLTDSQKLNLVKFKIELKSNVIRYLNKCQANALQAFEAFYEQNAKKIDEYEKELKVLKEEAKELQQIIDVDSMGHPKDYEPIL